MTEAARALAERADHAIKALRGTEYKAVVSSYSVAQSLAEIIEQLLSRAPLTGTQDRAAIARTCLECKFYRLGECHLNPAVRLPRKFDASASAGNRIRDEEIIWGWPLTGPKNWCGQFAALPPAPMPERDGMRESIYACAYSTLIGFSGELTEKNIKFICDQISRKAAFAPPDDKASDKEFVFGAFSKPPRGTQS
jgi:hypothetical protein